METDAAQREPLPKYPGSAIPTHGPATAWNGGKEKVNQLAIASLTLSVLSLFLVGSVCGIILGVVARRQVAASHGAQRGAGLATAGVVIGTVTLLAGLVALASGMLSAGFL